MQAHPTRRQVIVGAVAFRCVERRSDRRTAAGNRLSSSARRKGDWDVPFRILSTATLLTYRRSGTLWEGRFRSCLTQEEPDVLGCYR